MAQQTENIPVTIRYGIDAQANVLMQYSQPVQVNRMTVAQTEAMIKCLQEALEMAKTAQLQASNKVPA